MARHRNVRSMNYDEEIDDYVSDEYGTSLENGCVTPETEHMYMYSRERLQSVSKIWEPHNPPVKEEDEGEFATFAGDDIPDTGEVAEADRARLFDCLDKMRSVTGDSVPEYALQEAAKSQNFDPERALDVIFSRSLEKNTVAGLPKEVAHSTTIATQQVPSLSEQHRFSIETLLEGCSISAENTDIDALLGAISPPITTENSDVLDKCLNGAMLHKTDVSTGDTLCTLMESNLTLEELLGKNSPEKSLKSSNSLSSQKSGHAVDTSLDFSSLGMLWPNADVNRNKSSAYEAVVSSRHCPIGSEEVLDALDELLRAGNADRTIESNASTKAAPLKTTSPMAHLFARLRKRDENLFRRALLWYSDFYLRRNQSFIFESSSPDDIFKAARRAAGFNGKCREGVKKAVFPENRPVKSNQVSAVSVPPVGAIPRMTFGGKDTSEGLKPARNLLTKESTMRVPKDLIVEKEDNSASRKLSPDTTKPASSPKASRITKADPKVVQRMYDKERAVGKPLLNLVVIGHVDAGKSTLMGHLLYLSGNVNKKIMDKYEHESRKLGKASFAFAWVLDETSEERSRGITMDIAQAKLETPHRSVNLLDAPGHKEFIPNMITGAAQADVAVLVVNATRGEFETGFESGGQTREHTMLVRSLGVSQLAVAVNKLDTCGWSQVRFNEIVASLKPFLKQTGFVDQHVWFIPCSGLAGDNLFRRSTTPALVEWYNGPSLIEVIDMMKPPSRAVTRPLRMCITDVFKCVQSVGVCVAGRIESGFMAQGDKLIVMPAQETCVVKAITIDDVLHPRAFAGDHAIVTLDKCDIMHIVTGSVLCDSNDPIKVVSKFEAKVVIFNVETPITKGSAVILHFQAMSEQAHFGKLINELNRGTGEVIRQKPRCLSKNSSGVVVIKVARPICLELYQDSKDLGRITLRQGGHTVAAGIVTALL